MTARKRLHKLALWTGIAIPVLAAVYLGAYYRMVSPLNGLDRKSGNRFYLQVSPYYSFPWPLPARLNHPPLERQLLTFFAPAHRLDRALRPDIWFDDRFEGIGIPNPDGSFTMTDADE
jgi:hypothetical protein